ncbi:MAG TPA: HEAT repeat domain-containing protein [Candidatus Acidoferrum sp.]|nr:HEAT repeat domain-containing protein [Candidatus Acidoferrum sp.]
MLKWRSIFIAQAVLAAGFCLAGMTQAGQAPEKPNVVNAKMETRAVSGTLADSLHAVTAQAEKPEWVGYSVPEIAGDRSVCCGNYNDGDGGCRTCQLENENGNASSTRGDSAKGGTIELEGSRQLVVLFRVEGQQVTKIRVASEDCTLDAGGLPFVWLSAAKPAESVALLTDFVRKTNLEGGEREPWHGALTAIALHADASADGVLASFVAADQPEKLRKQATFWLGAARGKSGEQLLQNMARTDPSPEVRSQVAFALFVSHEPEALQEMIHMAHDDASAHVRGQALFWLAQKAGQKAMGAITGAIENDPDTEVKKKAVFALSQMPKDEGVPKLIEVAKTNHNREVRKQAMFWLGQSNDPRALEFFEQVLSH